MLFPKRNKITVIFICRTRRLPPSPPARSSTCRENHNPRPRTRCGRRPGRAPPRTSASWLGLPVSRRPGSPAAACLCHFVGTGQPAVRRCSSHAAAYELVVKLYSQSERLVEKGHSRDRSGRLALAYPSLWTRPKH